MSQGTFLDTLIQLKDFKRRFVFRSKIDFFKELVEGFWSKILKSAFFTRLCP